jgi:hypothetical protein
MLRMVLSSDVSRSEMHRTARTAQRRTTAVPCVTGEDARVVMLTQVADHARVFPG